MERFVIQGGRPLSGAIEVRGAKNASFPVLASSILTEEDVFVHNLPLIEDVFRALEILRSMRADVEWVGERSVRINTKHLDPSKIDKDLVSWLRGSILFLGPLLARFGKVKLPYPGGCNIGARPIDVHLDAFRQLGAKIKQTEDAFEAQLDLKKVRDREVVLGEFSVTATENVLLFAAGVPSRTTIKTADYDYQVQEAVRMVRKMGANTKIRGYHTIIVEGAEKLKGASHTVIFDPIEAGTFVLLGAAANRKLTVQNVELSFLDRFFKVLRDAGISFETRETGRDRGEVTVHPSRAITLRSLQGFIFPGLQPDLLSSFGVLATQTKGPTLLHDPLYEGRFRYVDELRKMGAEITPVDSHQIIVHGPTTLMGTDLGTYDLRGGATLLIAALIAQGESSISNVYQIDRGYEKIEERLQKLGADIRRVSL